MTGPSKRQTDPEHLLIFSLKGAEHQGFVEKNHEHLSTVETPP